MKTNAPRWRVGREAHILKMNIPQISIEFQGNLVKAKVLKAACGTGGKRGAISAFSRSSRKRLLELVSRLNIKGKRVIFITLTYGRSWPDGKKVKANLKAFLMWLKRRAPKMSGLWRMEFQKRLAPHFHLILFDVPYIRKEDIQAAWGKIINMKKPFTRIEMIRSYKKAFSYVSKYVAKMPDEVQAADVARGFNLDAYWHGRSWGVINRESLPYAKLTVLEGIFSKQFLRFKWYAEKVYPMSDPYRRWKGFCIFQDAQKWLILARRLQVDVLEAWEDVSGVVLSQNGLQGQS